MNSDVRSISIRLIFDFLLFVIVCTQWWWLALFLGVLGMLYFKNFYELIVLGVCFDLFFGVPRVAWGGFEWYGTIITIVLFGILRFIKLHLRHSFA